MANEHMKKGSTSLAIKEMQIKITLSSNLTTVTTSIFKKKNPNTEKVRKDTFI
jgi:hypothetical protein